MPNWCENTLEIYSEDTELINNDLNYLLPPNNIDLDSRAT